MKISIALQICIALLAALQVKSSSDFVTDSENNIPVQAMPEADFEEFIRLQITILRSNREDQRVLEATLHQHFELMKSLNNAVTSLLTRVSTLENQLSAFKDSTTTKFTEIERNVNGVNSTVSALSTKQQDTDRKANEALTKYQSCVTDVRFGNREQIWIWKNAGYVDTKPYILTGVDNWNKDDFADQAYRRKFQILRGGSWSDPTWL